MEQQPPPQTGASETRASVVARCCGGCVREGGVLVKSIRSRLHRRRPSSCQPEVTSTPVPAWESLESRTLLYGFGGFTFDLHAIATGLWRDLIVAADKSESGSSDGSGDSGGDAGNADTVKA